GVGGARADYVYAASFSETGGGGCLCASIAGGTSVSPTGVVYGAGAEWKAWSNLILGIEYLHYMLDSDTVLRFDTSSLNPLIALGGHVNTTNGDGVGCRANWLFNFGS